MDKSGVDLVFQSRVSRLLLIDGNAMLHRAYHALPPLTSPDGALVNAVYGFASMLLRLFGDLQPTHMAVAFDRPAPTFRKELYKEYQAQRPEMEDGLVSQVELVHALVTAFGIPIYELDGFEADDVLGSLASQATDEHMMKEHEKHMKGRVDQVVIVTGDRDLLQLVVDEKVLVFMPTKGISEGRLYTEKFVEERMGVAPRFIPDFKALAGDQSDNYPGVPGIGPKTAVSLLKSYGSIEDLYRKLDAGEKNNTALSEGTIQKLKEGRESALLGKTLATIRTDVPVEFDFERSRIETLDTPEARQMLTMLNFKSLLTRLGGESNEKREASIKGKGNQEKKKKPQGDQLSLV